MNNPFRLGDFAGITIGDGILRAARATRRGKKLLLRKTIRREFAPEQFEEAFRTLFAELALGSETVVLIAATIPGDTCFSCRLPNLKGAQLHSAIEFELPRNLPLMPENPQIQFVARPAAEGLLDATVQVFPAENARALLAALDMANCRIDEILHPLLLLPALSPESPVRLPELPGEFCWKNGAYQFADAPEKDENKELNGLLLDTFDFAGENAQNLLREFVTPLTAILFASTPGFSHRRAGLGILPEHFRPRRYRRLGYLAALLTICLIGTFAVRGFGHLHNFRVRYLELKQRAADLEDRTAKIKRQLAAKDKEFKEIKRVLDLDPGDHEILTRLATLSEKLPREAQLTNFRAADGNIDLTLTTSQSNLDAATPLRREAGYKISRLQQRRMGDTMTVITMQVSPQPMEVKK